MMSNAAIMAFAAFQDACLTHYGGEVENQMEMIKEFGIKIVRTCGVWGSTLALAKLAAGSIAVRAMPSLNGPLDPRIDLRSLAPNPDEYGLHQLVQLEKTTKEMLTFESRNLVGLLETWLWEGTISNEELFKTMHEALLSLKDIEHILRMDTVGAN